ncbi:hypothetical protein ACM66B_005066 [Microbotryomycetes sp. NB124-2]
MSTSSSPQNTAAASSTPATSTPAIAPADKMELDSDSSDIEVMQATTPVPKRKNTAKDKTKPAKKPKLDETPATKTKPAKQTPATADKTTSTLVELKKGKLVAKQKAFKIDSIGALEIRIKFGKWALKHLEDQDAKVEGIPEEHHGAIALVVQESSQTLAGLLTSTKNALVAMVKAGVEEEEDSQEVESKLSERFPSAPIKALIQELATRHNYGIDKTDLPDGLLDDDKEVPANLELWYWEVNNLDLLPADCRAKVEKRKLEREQTKAAAVELFLALPADEQNELLSGNLSKSTLTKAASKSSGDATASGSGSKASSSKSKVKTEAQLASEAEKAKEKEEKEKVKVEKQRLRAEKEAEKEAEKADKQAEREAKQAKKDEEQALKDAKKAEREAKKAKKAAEEEKRQALVSKQKNIMSGFFIKKSATPPVEIVTSKSKSSDFAKTFLPFHVRADVVVAPVNRFSKAQKGKAVAVEVNSKDKLTLQDSLQSFLKGVPKDRIPPYNPHPTPAVSVRATVTAIQESQLTGIEPASHMRDLKDWRKVRVKLLKFAEDVRPGYVGTWTKTSKTIGPRTPFDRDEALLNYDVDSEAEWEEEAEDAEDLKSGGEDSDDDGADSEALSDDWMCGDDEIEFEAGYTEEGDIAAVGLDADANMTGTADETAAARKRVLDREKKSKSMKDTSKKKRLVPIVPIVKGPAWEGKIGEVTYDGFSSMRVQLLNDAYFGLDPLRFVSKPFPKAVAIGKPADSAVLAAVPAGKENERATGAQDVKEGDTSNKKRPFPSNRMAEFLSNVLTSTSANRIMLQEEISAKMKGGKGDQKITKQMIVDLLKSIKPENLKKTGVDAPNWDLPAPLKAEYGL